MTMISELPPGLIDLAKRRLKDYSFNNVRKMLRAEYRTLEDIRWADTPEGFDFWHEIYKGNLDPYYGCRFVNIREKVK